MNAERLAKVAVSTVFGLASMAGALAVLDALSSRNYIAGCLAFSAVSSACAVGSS